MTTQAVAAGYLCREVGTHFYFLMGELFGGVTAVRASVEFPKPASDSEPAPCETAAFGEFKTEAGVPGTLDLLTGVAGDEQVVCRVYGLLRLPLARFACSHCDSMHMPCLGTAQRARSPSLGGRSSRFNAWVAPLAS